MKLSSRSRYAVSAMIELALDGDQSGIPIVELSKRYSISQSSMEQLFAGLRRHGLVKGRRGRSGGYKLARKPSEITVAEIIKSVENPNGEPAKVAESGRTPSEALWNQLSDKLYEFLDGLTLEQILHYPQGNEESGESFNTRRFSEAPIETRRMGSH